MSTADAKSSAMQKGRRTTYDDFAAAFVSDLSQFDHLVSFREGKPATDDDFASAFKSDLSQFNNLVSNPGYIQNSYSSQFNISPVSSPIRREMCRQAFSGMRSHQVEYNLSPVVSPARREKMPSRKIEYSLSPVSSPLRRGKMTCHKIEYNLSPVPSPVKPIEIEACKKESDFFLRSSKSSCKKRRKSHSSCTNFQNKKLLDSSLERCEGREKLNLVERFQNLEIELFRKRREFKAEPHKFESKQFLVTKVVLELGGLTKVSLLEKEMDTAVDLVIPSTYSDELTLTRGDEIKLVKPYTEIKLLDYVFIIDPFWIIKTKPSVKPDEVEKSVTILYDGSNACECRKLNGKMNPLRCNCNK